MIVYALVWSLLYYSILLSEEYKPWSKDAVRAHIRQKQHLSHIWVSLL